MDCKITKNRRFGVRNEGKINEAILFAAKLTGITKIFKVGGAQAIAAMTRDPESPAHPAVVLEGVQTTPMRRAGSIAGA